MRQTSRIAYQSKMANGSILSDKEAVYKALKKIRVGTQEDVANALKWPASKVWRRLSELLKDGKINYREDIKKRAGTGHFQGIWGIPGATLKVAI